MPEGDTIFRAAATLDRALRGQRVTRFETAFPQLARVHDQAPITARVIEAVTSRGKHLLMAFSGDLILRTHMRMHGSWHIYRPGERWQRSRRDMRIVVGTEAFEAVAFSVPVAEFRTTAGVARDPVIASLGPDLLDPAFDEQQAIERLRARAEVPIADALLDQRALAGIGNVFKSEVCFAAAVHPDTPVGRLADEALERIVRTARAQLRANAPSADRTSWIRGRRTTRWANPAASLWVYGRVGRPCRRCGAAILMSKAGGDARLTYWCPECQPWGATGFQA